MKYKIGYKKYNRGFTLVEMIVALALFAIVAVIAAGSLVRIVALNRQAQALQAAMNNVGFALDSMSREIRGGSVIYCGNIAGSFGPNITSNTCPAGGNFIAFRTSKKDASGCNLIYGYRFTYDAPTNQYFLEKAQQSDCSQALGSSGAPFLSLVSPDVHLTDYNLSIFSQAPLYNWVFLHLKGYAGTRIQDQSYFDVQTSISQRIHD